MSAPLTLHPKSDEDRLTEIEGKDTTEAYMRTLEELIYAKSLSEACKAEGCLPERTFHRVKGRSREAWQLYARARQSRADHRFDNLRAEIDNEKDPQKARVVFEAEKWTIGKMNRGLYGDEPAAGVQVTINNDTGTTLLNDIRERLEKKRKAIQQEGGGVQINHEGGVVERDPYPNTLPSPPHEST